MKRKIFALTVVAAFLFYWSSSDAGGSSSVSIYNSTLLSIPFSLSYDQQNWTPFTLPTMQREVYDVSSYGFCYIYLPTYDVSGNLVSYVSYKLNSGSSYQIYWNTYYLRWDITQG